MLEGLRSKLLLHEQCLQCFKGPDSPFHPQVFAIRNTQSNSSSQLLHMNRVVAGVAPNHLKIMAAVVEVVVPLESFSNIQDLHQITFLAMALLDKSHQVLIVLLLSLMAHNPPL